LASGEDGLEGGALALRQAESGCGEGCEGVDGDKVGNH
jgi:hypothetical protein